MPKFHYEWWTIQVKESTGIIAWEVKCRDREHAVKEIKRRAEYQNQCFHDPSLPWWERGSEVLEIFWGTLALDRTGHQR